MVYGEDTSPTSSTKEDTGKTQWQVNVDALRAAANSS